MPFFPVERETRLVTLTESQFYSNLGKFVKPVDQKIPPDGQTYYLFNGRWDKEQFSISLILKISNNFVPIINGEIVSSQEGLLVRLTYSFFPATKKLLIFWTVLTLLFTVFFIGLYQAWLYGAISFGICFVNYILSRENFKIQVRKSRRMIEKLFSYTEQ
jgi:hypothetical protein